MNNNSKIIEKVVQLTIERKIEWHRIKTSIDLYDKDNIMIKDFVSRYNNTDNPYIIEVIKEGINLLDSYIANFNDGNIFFFTHIDNKGEKYFLAIQSSKEAKVLSLNDKYELQIELKNLKYNISEQLDDVSGYINKLLNF